MPLPSLKLEKISILSQVLLLGGRQQLSEEVNHQLGSYPQIKTLISDIPGDILNYPEPSVIVHFVGFGKPSLSQTLIATELLHKSLNISLQTDSKLILVVSNSNLPICRTAITLVTQFIKVHKIRYEVVEVDPLLSIPETAEFIIGKFVYHHQKSTSIVPRPTSSAGINKKKIPAKRFSFLYLKKFLKYTASLICIFYLLFFVQLFLLIPLTNCAKDSFLNNQFSTSLRCTRVLSVILDLVSYQAQILPGTKTVLSQVAGRENQVTKVVSSFSQLLALLSGININSFMIDNPLWVSKYNQSTSAVETGLKLLYQSFVSPQPWLVPVAEKNMNLANIIAKLATLVPEKDLFLGYNRPVTYLLILQDSSSSWPTGGVIDTLLTFTLDGGVFKDPQIYDAKILSSQISGEVDPPLDLKRLTGTSNWLFLQANWDPDFPQTAKRVTWFFNKVFDTKVDFVIGLNDSVFPELLAVTGPLNVAGLTKSVTAGNYRSLKSSLINPNPEKNEVSFLGKTLISLKNRYQDLSAARKQELIFTVLDFLEKRQIMVSSAFTPLSELDLIGWNGRLHLSDCRSQLACQNMYLYPVDTQLSPDIPSYPINQTTNIQYFISSTQVKVDVSITMNHLPSLVYKRIFLPVSAHITSARVNNTSVLSGLFPVEFYPNLAGWGFLITPPANSESTLEASYEQPRATSDSKFHFYIDIPNQPGVGNNVKSITVNYPKSWQASVFGSPTVATPGTLRYNTSDRDYRKIEIDFLTK